MKKMVQIVISLALVLISTIAADGALVAVATDFANSTGVDAGLALYMVSAWGELSTLEKVLSVFVLLVPVFSLIVSLTATPRDDAWWGKFIYPALEYLALNFLKVKQKPGDNDLLKPYSGPGTSMLSSQRNV